MNEKLPLAGIRVLDMTRVLAGVATCWTVIMIGALIIVSRTVHRYWEILGMLQSSKVLSTY